MNAPRGFSPARFAALTLLFLASLLAACSSATGSPAPVAVQPSATPAALPTTAAPPTATATGVPTATATPAPPTPTATLPPTETATPLPSETPTPTLPPPTPSGEDAIYIYYVKAGPAPKKGCAEFSLVKLNTGLARSGNMEQDVSTALGRLFSKSRGFGEVTNPLFISNFAVESVSYHDFLGEIDVNLTGTYVRSGNYCDDYQVREQVWATIRQFKGIKTVNVLLNGNLLGDILAGRK